MKRLLLILCAAICAGAALVLAYSRLPGDTVETLFPAGEARVRVRTTDVQVPPPPAHVWPEELAPGEQRGAIRRPHPDDPPFVPLGEAEHKQWIDDFVGVMNDRVVECGFGRQELLCDSRACAVVAMDGPPTFWTMVYRRPMIAVEYVGQNLGLPPEFNRCWQAGHIPSKTPHLLKVGDKDCVSFRPPSDFKWHYDFVGMAHGQALCDVLGERLAEVP